MVILMIKSGANKISRDKGNYTRDQLNPQHCGSLIMSFIEYVGVIMDFQVPLLIIDKRCVLIMPTYSRTYRVTHLTLIDARVVME
jgi:hypothetical protein